MTELSHVENITSEMKWNIYYATRGNIIDEPALIDTLEAGYLSGAI